VGAEGVLPVHAYVAGAGAGAGAGAYSAVRVHVVHMVRCGNICQFVWQVGALMLERGRLVLIVWETNSPN